LNLSKLNLSFFITELREGNLQGISEHLSIFLVLYNLENTTSKLIIDYDAQQGVIPFGDKHQSIGHDSYYQRFFYYVT